MAKIAYSAAINSIRGKMGTDVFTRARNGATSRIRVSGRNPKTGAQVAVRSNLTRAATAFKNLTPVQALQWNNYALTITRTNPVNGTTYNPSGISVFVQLASKFLQINPSGTIPVAPPTTGFFGDGISITATAGTGQVTFTASAANATNVRTELLVQNLRGRNRVPSAKGYRSRGFISFVAGTLTATVNVSAGPVAVGYRFVNTLTGQATQIFPISILTVALSLEDGGEASEAKAA